MKKKKQRFSRKFVGIVVGILLLLSATGAYAAYDISQGGWLAGYFGQALGINQLSSKEIYAQRDAAKKAKEDQAKQDQQYRQNQRGIQKTPTPVTASWCGSGLDCNVDGQRPTGAFGCINPLAGNKFYCCPRGQHRVWPPGHVEPGACQPI